MSKLPRGQAIRPKILMNVGDGDAEIVAEGDDGDAEAEHGQREARKMRSPEMPSQAEVDVHELTHVPFRSWCRHCIRGRGKESNHSSKCDRESGSIPEFSFDWCFPGEEVPGKTLSVLVGRMRDTRMTLSTMSPTKSSGSWIASRVLAFFRECGCEAGDIVVKTDQEPAMVSLTTEMTRLRSGKHVGRMIMENSVKGDSQSNGMIERAVQSVEGIVRVMRSAFQENYKIELDVQDAIWPWLIEYGSYVLNRMEVGKDGKTSYERNKGKMAHVNGIQFGEGVQWKRKPSHGALGKLAILWEDGIFLGVKGTTSEMIVGGLSGVFRTRTIQRVPMERRWSLENLKFVNGVPWRKSDADPSGDGEKMESRSMTEEEIKEMTERTKWKEDMKQPHKFAIKLDDVQNHGATVKCKGCRALLMGKDAQTHTPECRIRHEKAMADYERLKSSKKGEKKFYERAVSEGDKRRKKEG